MVSDVGVVQHTSKQRYTLPPVSFCCSPRCSLFPPLIHTFTQSPSRLVTLENAASPSVSPSSAPPAIFVFSFLVPSKPFHLLLIRSHHSAFSPSLLHFSHLSSTMSSVFFIEPVFFGANTKIFKDNKFISATRVSASQAIIDHSQAVAELQSIVERLRGGLHLECAYLRLKGESRASRALYEDKPDAIFPNNSISFHNFVDSNGKVTRRVVVLYPMSPGRQGELPKEQLLTKLQQAVEKGVEVVDLRDFQQEHKYLEGTGAVNFSYNGQYVYMALSGRSDEEVLDTLCSKENLNIPQENRFIFTAALPRPQNNDSIYGKKAVEYDTVYHTNVVGWTGRDICAWGLDFIKFPTEEEQERFLSHLSQNYREVLSLNEEEIRNFAGNSLELTAANNQRVLIMSDRAYKSLQRKNLVKLEKWYGAENIIHFYADVIERRSGGSVRCLTVTPVNHGEDLPIEGQPTMFEAIGIHSS